MSNELTCQICGELAKYHTDSMKKACMVDHRLKRGKYPEVMAMFVYNYGRKI